jgi:hypothetical protein
MSPKSSSVVVRLATVLLAAGCAASAGGGGLDASAGAGGAGGGSGAGGGAGGSGGLSGSGGADAGAPDASGGCALATTADECDARPGCHSVFFDPHNCRCAQVGCCARFSRCADGQLALCNSTNLACLIQQPYCEGPYVVSYAGSCYEGCVRMTACAP